MGIFKILEKIFLVAAIFPPMYMAYRYVRWYVRSHDLPATANGDQE